MNEKKDTFSTFHPVINFTFYIGAFLLGMMLIHPVFLAFRQSQRGFLHYRKRKKGEEFSDLDDSAFSHAVLYQSFV